MKKKLVCFLATAGILLNPVAVSLGDSIEIRGNLYDMLGLPKGAESPQVELFSGKIGGGITPGAGACGLNAGLSFLYGIKSSLDSLDQFVQNWQSGATILALYALATYLPVAKEALLGANTLSNFLARLRGFSCSQAMETIKEMNYQDSFLVKKCIARKLGISSDDVDIKKSTSPQEWYSAYKECLNSANLLDIFGDSASAQKFLSFISPKSLAKCYLGVKSVPSPQEIANADLQTRAKYFLYMVLPDLQLSGNGLVRVQTVQIKDPQTNQMRPASMIDLLNFHIDEFKKDYDDLLEKLEGVVSYDTPYDQISSQVDPYFQAIENKYGISVDEIKPVLILTLKLKDYAKKAQQGQVRADVSAVDYAVVEANLDKALKTDARNYFISLVLDRLEAQLNENLARLKQAEEIRRSTGSGGMEQNGCMDSSST